MINIEREKLLRLHDVPKLLPPRPTGKRLHISAIYRWVQRGVRGIRLEVVKVGGTTYTSREALQRFVQSPSALSPTTLIQPTHPSKANRCIHEILHGKPGVSNN